MKIYTICLLFSAALLALSCGMDLTQSVVYEKIENPPESSLPKAKVGNIPCLNILKDVRHDFIEAEADSVEFVKLETSKKCLISFPQDFMYINGCYAILDQQTQALLLFGPDGKFLRQIGKRGQGPKEYDQLRCFTFSNGRFYLVDTYTNDLLCYEWDGTFVKKTHIEYQDYPVSITPLCDELYLTFSCNYPRQPYRAVSITRDCEIKQMIFPYEYAYPQVGENRITASARGNLLMCPRHSDTIFEISKSLITPKFTLGYYLPGEPDQIRAKYCALGPNEFYKFVNSEDDKSLLDTRVHELDDCIILEYDTSPKIAYLSVIDKRDYSCKTYQRYNRLKTEVELPFHLYYSDNKDHLISFCINRDWVKNHPLVYEKLPQSQKDLIESFRPDDNPMMIRIKMKKR